MNHINESTMDFLHKIIHCKQTTANCLTTVYLSQLSLLTSVDDWGGGISASCTAGSTVG